MTEVTLTCKECGSGVHVYPSKEAKEAECQICKTMNLVNFDEALCEDKLEVCPCCGRKDFYKQKDFNRKIGVMLFVIAAIAAIWTYGISLIVLYLFDLLLYRRLGDVAACYKCNTLFRKLKNFDQIRPFDHEMHDRIVYSDHDFGGEALEH